MDNGPIRVIFGTSCTPDLPAQEDSDGNCTARTVSFSSRKWDNSNNRLCDTPELGIGGVGDISRARDLTSTFSISWSWTGGFDGTAVAAHSRKTESVRLGEVTLRFPCVMFRGNELCDVVGSLLTAGELDSCT